ncbi:hypothetical protein PG987_006893 [Apiospora arundinis]
MRSVSLAALTLGQVLASVLSGHLMIAGEGGASGLGGLSLLSGQHALNGFATAAALGIQNPQTLAGQLDFGRVLAVGQTLGEPVNLLRNLLVLVDGLVQVLAGLVLGCFGAEMGRIVAAISRSCTFVRHNMISSKKQ